MTYRSVISQSNTPIPFNIKTEAPNLTISYDTRDLKPTLVVEKHIEANLKHEVSLAGQQLPKLEGHMSYLNSAQQ